MQTLFTSNTAVDCHILRGRLLSENIPCFIYDENISWVHPFRALAVGGIKLKVPDAHFHRAKMIIQLLEDGKLHDKNGEYQVSEVLFNNFKVQEEILALKEKIRNNPCILDNPSEIMTKSISKDDFIFLIQEEKKFHSISESKFHFTWKQFLYELFDFEGDVFKYFHPKPVEYYIEKDLVEHLHEKTHVKENIICPYCHSENVAYGPAIDFKWDFIYLILSLLFATPMLLLRKKYHCFACGCDFEKSRIDRKKSKHK